jgi:LPS sulfotransferase NodH
MSPNQQHLWDLWIADVGATGISFARGRLDPTDTIIVHAAPEKLNVEVRNSDGTVVARGENLIRTADTPMARLRIAGNNITREDLWPNGSDYGVPVIVAGGEVGTLRSWWNDGQHQEWRWSLEFYNHR